MEKESQQDNGLGEKRAPSVEFYSLARLLYLTAPRFFIGQGCHAELRAKTPSG
jgi:hypothetical protein